MKLDQAKILITGATGGIGAAIAAELALAGAQLVLVARDPVALAALQSQLAGNGHCTLALDLLQAGAPEQLRDFVEPLGITGLINVAGVNQLALLSDMKSTDINRITYLNLIVPMQLCRVLVPLLAVTENSFIVNVGSILGSIGYAGSTVYCASKFGLRGFTESLQRELADTPTRVIYFAPRATSTALNSDAMQALNNELNTAVDTPAVVAGQLLQALTKKSSSRFYLGWPEKFFVRLNGLLPRLVDNALAKQLPIIRRYATQAAAPAQHKTVEPQRSAESTAI